MEIACTRVATDLLSSYGTADESNASFHVIMLAVLLLLQPPPGRVDDMCVCVTNLTRMAIKSQESVRVEKNRERKKRQLGAIPTL